MIIVYGFFIILIAFQIRVITGFGGALISIPLLALFINLNVVLPVEAILEIIVSLILLPKLFKKIDKKIIIPLLTGGLIGAIIGTYVLDNISIPLLRRLLGVVTFIIGIHLLFKFYRIQNYQEAPQHINNPVWGFLAGAIGGILGGMFGQSGPPYTMYLSNHLRDKDVLRATLVGIFTFDFAWRVLLYAATGLLTKDVFIYVAYFTPSLLIGTWLGMKAYDRVSEQFFKSLLIVILLLSGFINIIS